MNLQKLDLEKYTNGAVAYPGFFLVGGGGG